jgi:hypothetical protein
MPKLDGCQISCLPHVSSGTIQNDHISFKIRMKRLLAVPWNYYVKKYLKRSQKFFTKILKPSHTSRTNQTAEMTEDLSRRITKGDWVRVKTVEEIQSTLDRWQELKGCAFLSNMWQYCGTEQQVLISMERFLDERDYKVKKSKGIVLLKDVLCEGTPVFGQCDRRCHLFWREEWLEKIF